MRNKNWFQLITSVVVAAIALTAIAALRPQSSEDRRSDRDEIHAHIDSIFRAYIEKDRETVRATHAPEWRGFLTNTRTIVRGLDQYMAEAEIALSRPSGMVGYEMTEFDVLFYGDVALVPYIAEMEIEAGGERFNASLRVLDVYAELNDHWIQIASNTGLHPDSLAAYRQWPRPLSKPQRQQLLDDREAVWRSWFANDRDELAVLIPEETVAISATRAEWADQQAVLDSARQFAESGAELKRLEFPETEIQVYGDVAVIYTTYEYELDDGGEVQTFSGRGTEIFVQRGGRWVNSGWHLDAGPADSDG